MRLERFSSARKNVSKIFRRTASRNSEMSGMSAAKAGGRAEEPLLQRGERDAASAGAQVAGGGAGRGDDRADELVSGAGGEQPVG